MTVQVGLTADQISKYEDLGYVMSGSRHSRMNAIRIRKENQVPASCPYMRAAFQKACYLVSHIVLHCYYTEIVSIALQVYTAEEKAALAMYNFEENKKKEQKILADMQHLVKSTLGDDEMDEAE